jgi:transcriptional regulator with XRE-family HTH domain
MEERQIQGEIGQRMQQAAEAKGLGPYDIALRLEVRPPTVYRWYQGEARPSVKSVRAFAALVERSVAYLETGEEPGDAVSLLLIQWADAVEGGEPARAAYERLTPNPDFLNEREKERLARLAPSMLAFIPLLSGGRRWADLPAALKPQVAARLMELLDQVSPLSPGSEPADAVGSAAP